MALQVAVNFPQRVPFFPGDIACLHQDGVKRRRAVALGHHKAVAGRPLVLGGMMTKPGKPQMDQYIQTGKRTARMPGLGLENHLQNHGAQLRGRVFQRVLTIGLWKRGDGLVGVKSG
jgi:2-hydroxychromene-2-carboxylate isomerase